MALFWMAMALLMLLAVGIVCYRLIFPAADPETTALAVNIRAQREHQDDFDRQLAAGEISPDQHQALVVDAQRKLLGERSGASQAADAATGRWLIVALALALPVAAGAIYWQLGAAEDVRVAKLLDQPTTAPHEIKARVLERLHARPANPYYWLLLGGLQLEEAQFAAAADAYRHAVELMPEDGVVRAAYAQALFLASSNRITDAVIREVEQALQLAPDNAMALELAGIAAFSKQDFRAAVIHWQRALQQATPGSRSAVALQLGMAQAQQALGDAAPGRSVTLRIALAKGFEPPATAAVFVFVREWQGRPMPVMARRLTVADLPITVTFTDAMALTPGRDLSSVAQVELVARVSTTGTPEVAAGDREARLGPVTLDDDNATFDLVIAQASTPR